MRCNKTLFCLCEWIGSRIHVSVDSSKYSEYAMRGGDAAYTNYFEHVIYF